MFVFRQHPDGPQHAHQPVPTAGDAGLGERHRPGHQEHGGLTCYFLFPTIPSTATSKNQYRKLETNNPRKGIARPQS
jgi:hypothetical protein